MLRTAMTGRSIFRSNGRKRHAFTLVELIVVIAIIAILAAVGVTTAVGYVKRSKFEKNNQNAVTLYQMAQSAISKRISNGTLDTWVKTIPGFDIESDADLTLIQDYDTNFSRHKTIALTFNKDTADAAEDKCLFDLVSPYFYDKSFFKATMTIELDISATKDNGFSEYSVNILSAFYSAENKNENGGWDPDYVNGSADSLPDRSESFRSKTSLVGYYNGKDNNQFDSLDGLSLVSIPWDATHELEGHIVGPTEDKSQASGYLFNVRNGETLDVSWAIFDADTDQERLGDSEYRYRYSVNPDHTEDLYILLTNADPLSSETTELHIKNEELKKVKYTASQDICEIIEGYIINRTVWTGYVKVDVTREGAENATEMTFPITKSLVTGDRRIGCPVDYEKGYYEYRLTLDAMMTRSTESNTTDPITKFFGIERLFNSNTPKNIYLTLSSKSTWKSYDNNGSLKDKTGLKNTYAARAIDDSVYLIGYGVNASAFAYYYSVSPDSAALDEKDDSEYYEDYIITGKAIVNTFFGDKVYGKRETDDGKTALVGGTDWSGTTKEAVLTNCRHLYNIRWMDDDTTNYKIVSDINWYIHSGSKYGSEVKVFSLASGSPAFKSPVDSSGALKIVSFPALHELKSNSTLTSISDTDRTVYSIKNFQLRVASFRKTDDPVASGRDTGYGLICKNNGTIKNLFVENLSLVLANVNDGSNCDYTEGSSSISSGSNVNIGSESSSSYSNNGVGALVGYNNGNIGSSTETDESINTVRLNNCVVFAGGYWKYNTTINDAGGVVGKNDKDNGKLYGLIKNCGAFAVIGYKNAGGIIGYCNSEINARLVVDGTGGEKAEIKLPVMNVTGNKLACGVIGFRNTGGAIGSLDTGAEFKCDVAQYRVSEPNSETGEIRFSGLAETAYHIRVILPENSLVLHTNGNENRASAGGAVGYINGVTGSYLSIYTDITGYVISSGNKIATCGGAIGREINNKVGTLYLDCANKDKSVIGSLNDSNPAAFAAGGAIGYSSTDSDNSSRRIVINVVNDGLIRSNGTADGYGSGGAVGGTSNLFKATFIVRAINNTGSVIKGNGSDIKNCNGTGGAIGSMGVLANDNTISLPSGAIIYAENHGEITGKYHVGGAIGIVSINNGKIFAVNSGTITGIDFVGGAVGCSIKSQFGTIQSVLDGTSISGGHFVGGAAGRILNFQNGAVIRTVVKKDSGVSGTGYLVGGVCGDIYVENNNTQGKIELKGNSTNPKLTVEGGTNNTNAIGTGGVCGSLRIKDDKALSVVMPAQADLNRLVLWISGNKDVGGAIGRVMGIKENATDNSPSKYINSGNTTDITLSLDVVLNPQTRISGADENVGGAVGYIFATSGKFKGHIKVSSVYGSTNGGSYIEGSMNVGGAIGKLSNSLPFYSDSNSMIKVDFTRSAWTVRSTIASGNNANAGGAIGYIGSVQDSTANSNLFPIEVRLGSSKITASGSNVGGAVGYNYNSLYRSDLDVRLDVGGKIEGDGNVGGVLGQNLLNQSYGEIKNIETIISGDITGHGDNVGGAVGINKSRVYFVEAKINGIVESTGNNVGGAIGKCDSDNKNYLLTTIDSTVQGTGKVIGADNVGGAVGYNLCNISDIISNISGNAKVIGENCVGGALGFASSVTGKLGSEVLAGNHWGRILRIKSTISADYALSGKTRMGGAVGQVGDKVDGTVYNSAALVYVKATLNSAYLFDPKNTGTSGENENACIGGVIGIFVDGRLGVSGGNQTGDVVLAGKGGVVHTDDFIETKYYPARTYSNTVFIGANGCSIGGIVGQIGLDNMQQNVCLSNISTEGNLKLCVVSLNGGDRIGGWIGSGYAAHGGIGNNDQKEFNNTPVTYNVRNVKAVISIGGSEIGGFCGRTDSYNNYQTLDKIFTFANINVDLSDANIIGESKVGGVFGEMYCTNFLDGKINVSLNSYTNIGDLYDNTLPGTDKAKKAVCYEAGGVVGSVSSKRGTNQRICSISVPINIKIDPSSRIAGLAVPESNAADYGVGGVFGRYDGKLVTSDKQYLRITSADGFNAAVRTAGTNAGGVVGYLINGEIYKAYVNVSVKADDTSNGISVGGFAGRITTATVKNCHVGPDDEITGEGYFDGNDMFGEGAVYNPTGYSVISAGSGDLTGGFAGSVESTFTLENCYTTVQVSAANGDSTGGFIGKINKGEIKNCYASGHTYSGQYISGKGDVTGSGYVGGFIGQSIGGVKLYDCYSTASVLGNGSYVGGFFGYRHDDSQVYACYCTGRVIGSEAETTGAFAGYSSKSNYNKNNNIPNYVLSGLNNAMNILGNVPLNESITNLSYADASVIKGNSSPTGKPFDSSLSNSYGFRAVIGGVHWGDWPVVTGGQHEITAASISMSETTFEYDKDGVLIHDYLTVTVGENILEYGTHYEITYVNNDRVGQASAVISGIGEYYGAVDTAFTITEASITNAVITIAHPDDLPMAEYEYTGGEIEHDIKVMIGDDELVKNTDYYLEYDPNNVDIGIVTVKVVGLGNYTGEKESPDKFKIVGRNLAGAEITLLNATPEELVYTGSQIKPGVIVRIDGRTLVENTDYVVQYFSNIYAGVAIVRIIPAPDSDQYSGEATETFEITQATNRITQEPAISGWTWSYDPSELSAELETVFGEPQYSVYTEETCSVADKRVVAPCSAADLPEAMKDLDAGSYYLLAEVAETVNYTGVFKIVPFTIARADITGSATVDLEYTKIAWDGDSHTPAVTVTFNGRTLDPSDYSVDYGNNTVDEGTKTITITGIKNCSGSVNAEYAILPVFRVDFETLGGSLGNQENPVYVVSGDTVTQPADPTFEGYRFDGWYKNASYAVEYNFSTPVTTDLKLYAKWTKLWTVTFMLYDGQSLEQTVPDGDSMVKPEDPNRPGYDFAGWYSDPDCTNKWPNFDIEITKDYTLYAKWDPQTHTVTFDSNGGSAVDEQTVTCPTPIVKPADPTLDGFVFGGWFTDTELTTPYDFDEALPVTEDFTLYAKWDEEDTD